MSVDDLPVASGRGVCRSATKDDSCASEQQRCVANVRVAGDPTDVASTEEDIVEGAHMEVVLLRLNWTPQPTCGLIKSLVYRLCGMLRGIGDGAEEHGRTRRIVGVSWFCYSVNRYRLWE